MATRMKQWTAIERGAMLMREFRIQRALIVVGLATSLVHFSNSALDIAAYPELSWRLISAVAIIALSRKIPDVAFLTLTAV